jgi:hypothetical protein
MKPGLAAGTVAVAWISVDQSLDSIHGSVWTGRSHRSGPFRKDVIRAKD